MLFLQPSLNQLLCHPLCCGERSDTTGSQARPSAGATTVSAKPSTSALTYWRFLATAMSVLILNVLEKSLSASYSWFKHVFCYTEDSILVNKAIVVNAIRETVHTHTHTPVPWLTSPLSCQEPWERHLSLSWNLRFFFLALFFWFSYLIFRKAFLFLHTVTFLMES